MTTVTITGAGTTSTSSFTLASNTVTAVNAGTVGNTTTHAGVTITGSNDVLTNTGLIRGGPIGSGANGAVVVYGADASLPTRAAASCRAAPPTSPAFTLSPPAA